MASKDLTYLSNEGPFEVYDKGQLKKPIDSFFWDKNTKHIRRRPRHNGREVLK